MSTMEPLDYRDSEQRLLRARSLRPLIYTLLALAVVVVAVLATPVYMSGPVAKAKATPISIGLIGHALDAFLADHGRYPTSAEGLDALVHEPEGMARWHPYLEKLSADAWHQPFVYRSPSTTGRPRYDLYSIGPDGKDGTADDIWDTP